jgi:3-methyladenine DNA glycosylase AlkD
MELAQAMAALEAAGTEHNRRVYPRHGVKGALFGVSHASLDNLKKQIKIDHALALDLWATGNHDARVLAARIADPARITAKVADLWAKQCDNYIVVEAFAKALARSPVAESRAMAWKDKKGEWIAGLAWATFANMAMLGRLDVPTGRQLLRQIEREIHDRPNRVRHEMNGCVIAIGVAIQECRQAALATADEVGTVYVDHGETGCKTPDAHEYIDRSAKSRAQSRVRTR